eukprot:858435-Pyramimonas_sp.AAC.1
MNSQSQLEQRGGEQDSTRSHLCTFEACKPILEVLLSSPAPLLELAPLQDMVQAGVIGGVPRIATNMAPPRPI